MRALGYILVFAVSLGPMAVAGQGFATRPGDVPEPAGLYQGALHGYTPKTLIGGKVVDTVSLDKLVERAHPVLIDVAEADRRPPDMAKTAVWLPLHRSIPGAVWMAEAGSGTSDPTFEAAFRSRVEQLTGGRRDKPIVVFCHPDCWASYNAAKRLIMAGYVDVAWYPDGVEGWQQDHETEVVKADQQWARFVSTASAKSE